jgi:Lar family restriction alleviation protein
MKEEGMKRGTQSVPEASAPVNSVPLPCPFCGEDEVNLTVDPDIESVVCGGCKATGPSMLEQNDFADEEEMLAAAIGAWNFRQVSGIKNGDGERE